MSRSVPAGRSVPTGRWIWDAFHRETPNQLLLLRRTLSADTEVLDGAMTVAARGSFRVWVDGVFVVHHDVQGATPGADAVRVDLTPTLTGGRTVEIVIGVHLLGVGTHHQPRALGGLLVEGSVRSADGEEHRLDSGPDWETSVPLGWRQNTPQAVWSSGYTEWSDRTLDDEPHGWGGAVPYPDPDLPAPYERRVTERVVDLEAHRSESGRIPHTAWAEVTIDMPDRAAALVAAGAVRETGVVRGADAVRETGTVRETDAAHFTRYRLPHQLVGFLTLTVDVSATTTIDVVMGETTDATGWPTATRQGIAAVDTVVVPAGRTVHRFWNRRCFRELAVVARTASPVSITAAFAAVTADRPVPDFVTTDARYRRMHAVSAATLEVGRQDLYEDCPLREGGHYVADARLQALFDLTTTGVADTSRRSLRQFAGARDPDGMIPALSPSGTHHRIPDFALQWVCQVDEHVRLADDDALLAELWPAVERTMTWADGRWRDGHFDVVEPGWWPFVDWYEFTPDALQAGVDAQYAAALRAATALADRFGAAAVAERVRGRLDEVLAALSGRLHHLHAAMILACALDDPSNGGRIDASEFDDFHPETGYCMFSLCRALVVLGAPDAARERLDRYWGGMLDAGAGTWWERWSPERPDTDQSLCHPWSAGPALLLPMLALGIDPLARDESSAWFAPVLDHAGIRAALHTPWGVVRSS